MAKRRGKRSTDSRTLRERRTLTHSIAYHLRVKFGLSVESFTQSSIYSLTDTLEGIKELLTATLSDGNPGEQALGPDIGPIDLTTYPQVKSLESRRDVAYPWRR